jgi:hypothetical protein
MLADRPLIYYLCNPTVTAGIDELLLRKKSSTLDQLRTTARTADNKHNVFYVSAIVLKSFRRKSSVSAPGSSSQVQLRMRRRQQQHECKQCKMRDDYSSSK